MLIPLIKTAAGAVLSAVKPTAAKVALAGIHEIAQRVAANAAKDPSLDVSSPLVHRARNTHALIGLPPGALYAVKVALQAAPPQVKAEVPRLEAALIRIRNDAAYLSEAAQSALSVLDSAYPTKTKGSVPHGPAPAVAPPPPDNEDHLPHHYPRTAPLDPPDDPTPAGNTRTKGFPGA